VDVSTQTDALAAQDTIDDYLTEANAVAGIIGASVSRFQVAVQNLQQATENFRAAESRIVDADVAEEAAQLTKRRILQQAGAAVLAQANQQPQLALRLLKISPGP
jgi:flagellin